MKQPPALPDTDAGAAGELDCTRWKLVGGQPIIGVPHDFELPPIIGAGNDYRHVTAQRDAWLASRADWSRPVSLVVPVYNRKRMLARTLAALAHQTYPAHLIEIIIADDGSSDGVEEVIHGYRHRLCLQRVFQQDQGFRLSAVRNLGIAAATHDCLILLDCDMLPVPGLVAAFMAYLHVTDQAVLIGDRRFVNVDAISDADILADPTLVPRLPDIIPAHKAHKSPGVGADAHVDWRRKAIARVDGLHRHTRPFEVCCGGNIAFSRSVYEAAGPFDERFQDWGCEDQEWGYRAYNQGCYVARVPGAVGLHQEPPGGRNETDRRAGLAITRPLAADVCPALYRTYEPGRRYSVPKVSIYMLAHNAAAFVRQAIDSALTQDFSDLEVCVVDDGSTDETASILDRHYRTEPRVRWVSVPERSGIAHASNTAVRVCRGEYIGQLDADDMLVPHAVGTLVRYLDAHPSIGCAYSSYTMIDEHGRSLGPGQESPTFCREKLSVSNIVHHFRMFRKRDWTRTAGFDPDLSSAVDYDMSCKLSEVCGIAHLPDVLYRYRRHGHNTSIVNAEQQRDHVRAMNKMLARTGLDRHWRVHAPLPDSIDGVAYRRRERVHEPTHARR